MPKRTMVDINAIVHPVLGSVVFDTAGRQVLVQSSETNTTEKKRRFREFIKHYKVEKQRGLMDPTCVKSTSYDPLWVGGKQS